MFNHFPGVLKIDTRLVQNVTKHYCKTPGRSQCVISGSEVMGRFQPFSSRLEPNFNRKLTFHALITKNCNQKIL